MDSTSMNGMGTSSETAEIKIVCRICEREVPVSEAVVPEATDYMVHFCGLDCYARWTSSRQDELARR
jgi:hypothetical protein